MNVSDLLSNLDPRALLQAGGLFGATFIIFAETGLFVGFFFPGDSLLFTAGFLASQNFLDIRLLLPLLFFAAVAGNLTGYAFGKDVGPKLFSREDSIFFHKKHVEKTKLFFEKHGAKTIFFARFFPIIRTFTPILAGVGGMPYRQFVFHTVCGGFVWTVGLTVLGYVLGTAIPDIDRYLLPIIAGIVIVSLLPGIVHLLLEKMKK
ncbi:VTT domain-containing protein [Candidatus Uhrbacteria bacterium]|nr:VTT domain-containing protein [Candidatus Uhrbacteria bacterium]